MKKRYGWVSNSSSSSFTCDVCGESVGGFDMSLSDFDMSECENGHEICNEHKLDIKLTWKDIKNKRLESFESIISTYLNYNDERYTGYAKEYQEEYDALEKIEDDNELQDYFEDGDGYDWYNECVNYSFPAELCPVCQFDNITDRDVLRYMLWFCGQTRNDILSIVKSHFPDYKAFREAMKNENP